VSVSVSVAWSSDVHVSVCVALFTRGNGMAHGMDGMDGQPQRCEDRCREE